MTHCPLGGGSGIQKDMCWAGETRAGEKNQCFLLHFKLCILSSCSITHSRSRPTLKPDVMQFGFWKAQVFNSAERGPFSSLWFQMYLSPPPPSSLPPSCLLQVFSLSVLSDSPNSQFTSRSVSPTLSRRISVHLKHEH